MTTVITVILDCDHPLCTKRFISIRTTGANARKDAATAGWLYRWKADYCPTHARLAPPPGDDRIAIPGYVAVHHSHPWLEGEMHSHPNGDLPHIHR